MMCRMPLEDLSLILNQVGLFRDLPQEVREILARATQVLSLAKGQAFQGSGVGHVMSGHLKQAITTPDGSEKVIDILGPHRQFGLAELFGRAGHACAVVAVTPVVLLQIGREAVLQALEICPELPRRMLGEMARRQFSIEHEMAADGCQSGASRVEEYLLSLAEPTRDGRALVDLPFPKLVMAARLGLTPETLSRIFREMSEAGLIEVRGRQVWLQPCLLGRKPTRGVRPSSQLAHAFC
ncbi:MAG: Crp/Fnr family transcriptional regulator [Zoogloea sp.]